MAAAETAMAGMDSYAASAALVFDDDESSDSDADVTRAAVPSLRSASFSIMLGIGDDSDDKGESTPLLLPQPSPTLLTTPPGAAIAAARAAAAQKLSPADAVAAATAAAAAAVVAEERVAAAAAADTDRMMAFYETAFILLVPFSFSEFSGICDCLCVCVCVCRLSRRCPKPYPDRSNTPR